MIANLIYPGIDPDYDAYRGLKPEFSLVLNHSTGKILLRLHDPVLRKNFETELDRPENDVEAESIMNQAVEYLTLRWRIANEAE